MLRTDRWTEGRTDGRTDRPKPICPLNFFEVGGIKTAEVLLLKVYPFTLDDFTQVTPYFFSYKTVSFFFENNPKNVDPSYKIDLDFWDCFERVKLVLQQNFIGLIYLFVIILQRGKPHVIAN